MTLYPFHDWRSSGYKKQHHHLPYGLHEAVTRLVRGTDLQKAAVCTGFSGRLARIGLKLVGA